ncbi:cytochrome b/b6 domain-containing protein, partial [Thiocystis violacea]|uniref:cytochrome b/b6 domain-containing protein n=1 Tax=Thiocystis violacea TaxID=13725 RepID=UPI0031F7F275
MNRIKLWDLPTRIHHWLLAVLVALAFATGLTGGNWMVWHGRIGLAILGLLTFRLAWGLVGSTYARFSQFVRGPGSIVAYLRGRWHGVGHNPLGALSVLALLGLLLTQSLLGLFATDDIAFKGPLYAAVSMDTADWAARLHRQLIWVVGALVILHICATLFYTLIRKDNMIRPMVSGYKTLSDSAAASATGGGLIAFLFAFALAAAAVWVADGGLLPPPPP